MATRFPGWKTGLFAFALLASGWAFPPAAADAGSWTFETAGSVPAGCSGPTVRLTGFEQDDQERLVAGWQESSGCGGPITFRWAPAEAGVDTFILLGFIFEFIRSGVDAIWCAVITATNGEPC